MSKIKGTVLFGNVITTAVKGAEKVDTGIILPDSQKDSLIDAIQEVVAIGDHLEANSKLEVGDRVLINFDYFYSPNDKKLSVPAIEIDGEMYLYLEARHIKYVLGKGETAK